MLGDESVSPECVTGPLAGSLCPFIDTHLRVVYLDGTTCVQSHPSL